jgi:hypothetical protein
MLLGSLLLSAAFAAQFSAGFTLQGQITTDIKDPSIRLVLEDPRDKNRAVAQTETMSRLSAVPAPSFRRIFITARSNRR